MMEVKKNPKKDLNRNSGMYFIAGLAMVLALTYVALEWKTFYGTEFDNVAQNVEENIDEDAPIFQLAPPPPPPPPPVAPDVIEVVEDEAEVEESIFESTESSEEKEVIKAEDIDFAEEEEDVSVIFRLVEDVPVFPGCENESDKRSCFNKMIKKHIKKNFRYPELEQEMGIQGRVNIMFEIQDIENSF